MIDVGSYYREPRHAAGVAAGPALRHLCWRQEWNCSAGRGVTAGLLDTGIDEQNPDLAGADLAIRNFTSGRKPDPHSCDHGTHSAGILVGQGQARIRGIVPRARLLVAQVVEPDGVAAPGAVAEALDWLLAAGARIVAIPLGDSVDWPEIAQRIERGHRCAVTYFAAAGNGHPDPVAFPARHRFAIAVGATDRRGRLLSDCSRSPRLDLAAPGSDIAAPVRGRMVRRRSGSSVACVVASGVAVLALSAGAVSGAVSRTKLLEVLYGGDSPRSPEREDRHFSAGVLSKNK